MAVDLGAREKFAARHIGPDAREEAEMLAALGVSSLDALIAETVPAELRMAGPLELPPAIGEPEVLDELRALGTKNQIWKSFIGMGYSDCFTPPVIQRNVLENPGWYTQYTPYQAEISQGRLEALLNFQTMVADLTGLPIANASLLDEATAAAEAMHMLHAVAPATADLDRGGVFLVADACHPQTIEVVRTRAKPLGIEVRVGDPADFDFTAGTVFGALVQYPATDGALPDLRQVCARAHAAGALVAMATDLLALTVLAPPGELGADVAVGNSQRFGVPLGYGGPHAAFFATRAEWTRKLPGRLIGVSEDAHGQVALRMALQTREQHIRREKATSNICTAQVLLAVMAGMYAVYHGPGGLRAIAERVGGLAAVLAAGLGRLGRRVRHAHFFDTVRVDGGPAEVTAWMAAAAERRMNLRRLSDTAVTVALDETTTAAEVEAILKAFAPAGAKPPAVAALARETSLPWGREQARSSAYLTHPTFNTAHSETEMLRYLRRLEAKDLSLTHAMIPLGSCTMKLNATVEMLPVTWPVWGRLHPFVPAAQAEGYRLLCADLERMLCAITGFAATSLQPNAGSQGEYAGLLAIRGYHDSRAEGHRDVCLIPSSAHGTNPASAVMAGYRVVVVACDDGGNVDLDDLGAKAAAHRDRLAALMVTYPSTHGVFEPSIRRINAIVHEHGGQVYMDGANLNAQVGLCRPAELGADVCHINLHKTFCIPHGGGGPGMGPIGVAPHLAPFLPRHPLAGVEPGATGVPAGGTGAVSAAPFGSASILLISWAYIRLMGPEGLTRATKIAILNANYVARRLDQHYPVVYRGQQGRVAHECIVDARPFKKLAGVEVDDVAKRLMDYGFHAPTMSFPIAGTLMIEPTESESKAELDRFCDAMIAIRGEIAEIESGAAPRQDNLLKNAPHTAAALLRADWPHPYSRERAAFPLPFVRAAKFWPSVSRLNNVLGDRKLFCTCPDISAWATAPSETPERA